MRRTRRPPRDRASGSAAATHAGAARGLLVLLGAALLGARGGRARLPDADWETLPQVDYEVAAATVEPTSTTTTITTGPPTTPALTRDAPRPDDSGGAIGAQLLKGKLPVRIGLTRGELKAVLTMVSGRLRKEAGELSTNRVNDWDLVLASDAYAKSAVPYVLLLAEQARGNGTGAASCTSRGGEARSHGRDGSTATTTEKNRSALIKKTVAEIQAELKSSRGQNKEQKRVPDLNNISDQLQILSALLTEARKEAEAAQATSTPEPPQPPTVKPSARHPAQPTNPAQPSSQPVQPPAQPGQPLAQPAQPIAQPGQPLAQPVQPPGQPARPMQPAQPPPQPARLPLQPVGRPAPPALPMQPVQSMSTQPTHPTQQGETTHTGSPGQPGQPAWPPPLPGSVPGHATGQAAGQAAGQVQGPQPGHDPGQTLGQAPVLGQAPGHTLGTAPTSAPGHSSSGNSPGLAPGLALPQVPGQTVGHASEPTPVMSGYVPQHEAGSAQSPRPQVFAVPPYQSNPSQAQSPGGLPLSPLPPNTQPSSPQQPANAQPQTLNPVRAQPVGAQPVGAQPVGAQPLGAQRPWQSQPAQQEHPYQQAQGQSHPYATQHQNHPPAPDSSATPVGAGGPQPQQQGQPSMPMAMSEPPAPSTLPQAPAPAPQPQPQPQPNSQLKTQPQPSPQAPQSPQVQAQVQAPAQPQDQPLASLKHPGEVLPPVAGPLRPAGSAAVAGAGAGSPLPTGSFQPVAPAEPSDATTRPSASDALNAAPDFAGSGGSGGAGQGSGSAGHPEYGAGGEPGSRGTPPPPADETTTEGTETPSPLREHIAPIAELSQAFAGLPGMSGLSYGLNEIPGMSTTGDTLGRRLGATAATPVSSSHLGRALQLPDEETPAISQRGQTRTPHPTAGHVTTAPLPRSADSQSTTHSLSGVAHDGFHDLVGEGGNGHKDSDPGPSPVPVRIVNGEDADITDVPYQVALEYWNNFLCGGSIISEWWVLTAAHCIARRTTARLWLVRMGTSLRQKGGRTVRVRQVIPHPSYTSTTHGYDVGLLRLAQRAALGRNVRVVNLSRRGAPDPATGTPAVISGWGSTSFEFGEKASKLQRAQVEVVERANCSAEYNEMGLGPIRADELCAGGKPRDACQGDSGGPMVDLAGVQVGIVSWGAGCATNPGVYTKVGNQDVRDFIRRTAGV